MIGCCDDILAKHEFNLSSLWKALNSSGDRWEVITLTSLFSLGTFLDDSLVQVLPETEQSALYWSDDDPRTIKGHQGILSR